jgi:hypothetical protein
MEFDLQHSGIGDETLQIRDEEHANKASRTTLASTVHGFFRFAMKERR